MLVGSTKCAVNCLTRHAHSLGNLGKGAPLIAHALNEVQPIQIWFASWTHLDSTLSRERACVGDHPSCRPIKSLNSDPR
jgi:hypothetical protein